MCGKSCKSKESKNFQRNEHFDWVLHDSGRSRRASQVESLPFINKGRVAYARVPQPMSKKAVITGNRAGNQSGSWKSRDQFANMVMFDRVGMTSLPCLPAEVNIASLCVRASQSPHSQ